jgi:hypothetical protein
MLIIAPWLKLVGSGSSSKSLMLCCQRTLLVYCDNVGAVYLSTNPVQHQHMKHAKIDLHFVRKRVAIDDAYVLHVPTISHFMNIFMNGLPTSVFFEFLVQSQHSS